MEAHGGYSFCGLAALVMLGKQHLCDLHALLASSKLVLLLHSGCLLQYTVNSFCILKSSIHSGNDRYSWL